MALFPLPIFPVSSLASSIIPVVWVGMAVVCFFNLRLGWVLSGLVVPGYVVPLILIKPWSAGVIFLEGMLTYFLVWLFSEYSSRWASWNNLFGRDRFFALVLCSIVVRLLFDGWLLPAFGEWLNHTYQLNFDYRNHLHSFGLIIIALTANQFWKTGFLRGLFPFTAVIALTLLIVRYGLMEFTNFGLSNISYLYEDMAASILASPKAYIILVTTAFLASRMNLHYGWDFNGILIPSLLALQWYQPVKILATMVEAGVILLLATGLLCTPWLKKMTIEGARKLLLFFNVSFAYKIFLGYLLLLCFPTVKVTDYFGFGYLLATLMAVKIHDKAIFARLTRATMQTSLTAVVVASVIGYGLTLLPISNYFHPLATSFAADELVGGKIETELSDVLKQEEVKLYQAKVNDSFMQPLAQEIEFFSRAVVLLQDYLQQPDPIDLQQARELLSQSHFVLDIVQDRYLYLHEKSPLSGQGVFVFDMQSQSKLSVSVPAAMDERGIYDAGVAFFQTLNAGSLAISGSSRHARSDLTGDVLQNRQTFFHQFHKLTNRHDAIQLRAYGARLARQLTGNRLDESEVEISGLDSTLWTSRSLPNGLDLVKLKQLIGSYQIEWSSLPFENQQRVTSGFGFAELILSKEDMRKLLFKPLLLDRSLDYIEQDLRIDGYLQEWILNSKDEIAPKGSELYQIPKQGELLFLDEQVVTPILQLIDNYSATSGWTDADQENLQLIARAAKIMGYQLIHYKHRFSASQYLILSEQNATAKRYWGSYVFRLGVAKNYVLEIPRSLFEINSFEYGIALFERLKAKALLISTTHPYANLDASSDLIAPDNTVNMFNLVNQVILREQHEQEMLVVNSRAFSYRPDQSIPEADVLFAMAQGQMDSRYLPRLAQQLLDQLQADGMSVQMVDGSESSMGYEVGGASQAKYLQATENKQFAVLWLSPLARAGYRQQDENLWQNAQFAGLKVETVLADLGLFVLQKSWHPADSDMQEFKNHLFEYVDNSDVLRLQQLTSLAHAKGFRIKRIIDSSSKQAFIVILDGADRIHAIANLVPGSKQAVLLTAGGNIRQQIDDFVDQRKFWLVSG